MGGTMKAWLFRLEDTSGSISVALRSIELSRKNCARVRRCSTSRATISIDGLRRVPALSPIGTPGGGFLAVLLRGVLACYKESEKKMLRLGQAVHSLGHCE